MVNYFSRKRDTLGYERHSLVRLLPKNRLIKEELWRQQETQGVWFFFLFFLFFFSLLLYKGYPALEFFLFPFHPCSEGNSTLPETKQEVGVGTGTGQHCRWDLPTTPLVWSIQSVQFMHCRWDHRNWDHPHFRIVILNVIAACRWLWQWSQNGMYGFDCLMRICV